jgi:uncharacterized protein (DUF169 family)
MTRIADLYGRLISAFRVDGLQIPVTYVKLFRQGAVVPDAVRSHAIAQETLTVCQAVRHAALEQAVYLTSGTIGCVAAAISLGMVAPEDRQPMTSPLPAYLQLMAAQSDPEVPFQPPTPGDFTDGTVYACRDAGRPEYGLFGPQDSGRFATRAIARQAVAAMDRIEPADTKGVFFYTNNFQSRDILPDVILLDVRPVELTRLLQGYQFLTGKAVQAWMNPLRAVDADLIARPLITGEINVSSYCLGARMLAQFSGNRLGMGIPYAAFASMVRGMEASATGYPFHRYAGAVAGQPS